MKITNQEKLEIIIQNTVFKENISADKNFIVNRWLNISMTTEKADLLRLKNEDLGNLPEDLLKKNTMFKIVGAILFALWILAAYTLFNPTFLWDVLMVLAKHTYTIFFLLPVALTLLSVVVGLFIVGLFFIYRFTFKSIKKAHLDYERNKRLNDPDRHTIISIDKRRYSFVSTYTVTDVNNVLEAIDFEKTIENFRSLDKKYGIILRHALINEQKAALCYLK